MCNGLQHEASGKCPTPCVFNREYLAEDLLLSSSPPNQFCEATEFASMLPLCVERNYVRARA